MPGLVADGLVEGVEIRGHGGVADHGGHVVAELAASTPDVAAEARRSYDATTAVLTEALERAQREGDLDPEVSAGEIARAVLTAQLGLVALGRTGVNCEELTAVAHSAVRWLLPASPQ